MKRLTLFFLLAADLGYPQSAAVFDLNSMSCTLSLEPADAAFPVEHIKRQCNDKAGNLIEVSRLARSQLVPGRQITPYRFVDRAASDLDCTLRPAASSGPGSDNGPFSFDCTLRFQTASEQSGTVGQ